MTMRFTHRALGQRVLFDAGNAAGGLAGEVRRLGARRVMVISSPSNQQVARRVTSRIDVRVWHDDVAMHVPADLARRATAAARDHGVDAIVCVGGGSTIGLAKVIALRSSIPIIAVPTTYSGSEATNVWGMTEGGAKHTGVDDSVLPVSIIYDAELTFSLPLDVSIPSGLNAVAHCVDSLWAPYANPINRTFATEGTRALASGLPRIVADPHDLRGREEALYGAYLSAVAFASAGAGMHHKICHVLGGTFNLPHAQTHAVILPYVLGFNTSFAPEAEGRIAASLSGSGAGTPVASAVSESSALTLLLRLYEQVRAPRRLEDYGFTREMIPEAVALSIEAIPPTNPRPVTNEDLSLLLESALTGADPHAVSTGAG